ncbi:response regulator [Paraburkholderia sp. MMS20-SJTN17]|uniref:Response regulator n=1 Tax=Paraburkholderia translucens TaxID=2886945 RepID=A0ABS8KD82_9BURK|nr:response regulator [Paraburkholderia sp. MMS20-SJTN17]MCC8402720.1 response regulator [Paraburkholderia sp. MMS20-SJTN17]
MRNKTVCIIDDELAVRQSLGSLVRAMGALAREYESAEAFLSHGRHPPVDCVVCDIQMDHMSGVELIARLRAEACDVPFIFVTGHFTERRRAEAERYGALCVLEKPFDPEQLVQWIGTALWGC